MSQAPSDLLSIGELGARVGLAPSAIRFYERKGLLSSTRSDGGQRRFARSELRRLSFVLITQSLGFSLAEIRASLDSLPRERSPTKRDWERLARGFREELEAGDARLESLRERLTDCIGCGCLSLASCRIYNPDDAAADLGEGPRYVLGDEPR